MDDLLTVKDVAKKLGVHANTVRQMIYSGKLKATKITRANQGQYRISPKNLKIFMGGRINNH